MEHGCTEKLLRAYCSYLATDVAVFHIVNDNNVCEEHYLTDDEVWHMEHVMWMLQSFDCKAHQALIAACAYMMSDDEAAKLLHVNLKTFEKLFEKGLSMFYNFLERSVSSRFITEDRLGKN